MKDSAPYVKIVEWSDEDACYVGSAPGLVMGGCHGADEQAVFAEPVRSSRMPSNSFSGTANRFRPPRWAGITPTGCWTSLEKSRLRSVAFLRSITTPQRSQTEHGRPLQRDRCRESLGHPPFIGGPAASVFRGGSA